MLSDLKSLIELFVRAEQADRIGEVDPKVAKWVIDFARLLRTYFRAQVYGIEKMPSSKALLVGNHNAGITFFEPFILGLAWYEYNHGEDSLNYLGHDAMVDMPLVGNFLRKIGMIRASHEAADAAFAANRKVLVFPGGNYEAFRPFKQRHRVDFGGKTGYVRLALRNRVPIVPVMCLGGHETFFVLHRGEKLADLIGTKKLLRSESFPLFLGLPTGIGMGPVFHFPLPAKLEVELGEPISLEEYSPEDANDRAKCQQISERVQGAIQAMMDARSARRKWPIWG